MEKEKVNNSSIGVYDQLLEEILYLELEPGQIIGEVETATRFNVSRTPVRDAFKKLESIGLLEIKSHVGTMVSLIDLNQITDILYMREKLELAVMNDLVGSFTQIQEFKLNYVLSKQKQLFEKNLPEKQLAKEFILADNEFHKLMFDLVNKRNIWDYLSAIEYHYERFRMFLNFTDEKILRNLYEEHEKMASFIMEKNIDDLKELYISHLHGGIHRGGSKVYEKPEYFKNLTL